MPTYVYKCPNPDCGIVEEFVKPVGATSLEQPCLHCGTLMVRDYAAERHNIQGGREYRRPIVSDSLAMNPNQIEEHRKMFPDVKVLDDGRPVFTNFRDHDNYLKATGFIKNTQKTRKRGKRIA